MEKRRGIYANLIKFAEVHPMKVKIGIYAPVVTSSTRVLSGGPLDSLSQPFFLTLEVAEIIPYRQAKPYENLSFLTDLYLKRGWSLRRISEELSCSKTTVRKKLTDAGVGIKEVPKNDHMLLGRKVKEMRARGLSYQAISDLLNLWRINTRTGNGKWHAKSVRDISSNQ